LKNSSVKYIATATIGFDHIDTAYCRQHNIGWANAPGCNAKSVQQYIAAALCLLQQRSTINLAAATVGIVGVGHVGKLVAKFCKTLGIKTLLNDPPRQRAEKSNKFVSLEEIAQKCDVITFHTPLTMKGEDKTFHLGGDYFFHILQKKPVIIDSARGEICNTEALKKAKREQLISGIVLDCWENEPDIDVDLLAMCDVATPHIAGYSADGKANATTACVRYISKCFGLGMDNWQAGNIPAPEQPVIAIDNSSMSLLETVITAVLNTYAIEKDGMVLKNNSHDFELYRNHYPLRREFNSYTVALKHENKETVEVLEKLGFKVSLPESA
jgi:erythronate-4-phosphate dehydrogenase